MYSVTPKMKRAEFPLYMDVSLALSRTLQTCSTKQWHTYMHTHLTGHTPAFKSQRVTRPESTTSSHKCST